MFIIKILKKMLDDIFSPSLFINHSIYIYFFFAYKKGSKMLKIKLSIDLFLNS